MGPNMLYYTVFSMPPQSAECWRSAADLTATLLEAHSQGAGKQGHPSKHTTESIQVGHVLFLMGPVISYGKGGYKTGGMGVGSSEV